MEAIRRLVRRASSLIRHAAVERTLGEELRHHLDCETEDLIRRGVPPDVARRQALLALGGVEQIKEDVRDARGTRRIEDAVADLRYAARLLRRNPGHTIAALLTFALGIGIATSIFSVAYGVLVRPLPYERPDRLTALWEHDIPHNVTRNVVSLENFIAWQRRARSFTGLAALMPASTTLDEGGEPERVVGAEASTGYFRLLGVRPALGRGFVDADEHGPLVTILGDALWKRRFGADPAVVGRTIRISGKPCTIVGVMPPWFDPPRFGWLGAQALWFPLVTSPERRAWGRFLLVVGRLRDDVSVQQADAELKAIASSLEQELPADKGWSGSVVPLRSEMTGDARDTLLVLLAAVLLLLAMGVTNVGTLTLAAMQKRGLELAVRRALGATDRRLFRQLFAQSALVATLGMVTGTLIAPLGVRMLLSILPPDMPRAASIRVDAPVLAITALVGLFATIAFGTAAAFRGRASADTSLRVDGTGELQRSPRTTGGRLTAAGIALAVSLSVMAVLMVRSVVALATVDLGFDPDGVAIARVALPDERYGSNASQALFFERLLARVRTTRGVIAAGTINIRPLGGLGPATTVVDPSHPPAPGAPAPVVDVRVADGAAFRALRIPIIEGTLFDPANESGTAKAIITRALARTFWPGADALGRKLTLAMYGTLTVEVIGVVEDVHLMDARTPARPSLYLSAGRFAGPVRDVVIRTGTDPASAIPVLRSELARLDRSLPLYAMTTMTELADRTLAAERGAMYLLIAFALSALLLAGVGVFGLVTADVTRRRREIGIRLALGAGGAGVVLLLLRGSLVRAVTGICIGTTLAVPIARMMGTILFGVGPADPTSLLTVAGAALTLATAATLAPALRAVHRSPLSALREG